ncbi:MAG: hypothetical protein M3067_00665 [Chloroflexota bacterium]|nr:hypothetical protein [Chloroflexota bacterium]
MPASAPPPAAPPGGRGPLGRAPGLREQLGATRGAFVRLISAHIALARAELADIMSEVQQVAILSGIAIGALILAAFLVPIGLSLFVGETVFGSMGWGVLHGPLLLADLAMVTILVALGVGGGRVGVDFLLAALFGLIVGLILGLDLTNRGWTAVGEAIAPNIGSDIRPLVVASALLAIVFTVLGLIGGGRSGGMAGALGGGILGAILGALLGLLTAVAVGPRVGAAIGVTAWLLAWPVTMGIGVARRGIDTDALKARFWPDETIKTTKETIEWVRARTPLGPRS